jgi:hypothetical protein
MKKLLFIFLPLLFIGCATTLPPAGPTDEIIDRADKILLIVDETPNEAYKHFAQHLSSNGFGFDHTDETLKILTTNLKPERNSTYYYRINASIQSKNDETSIIITGKVKFSSFYSSMIGSGSDELEIENRGQKKSLFKLSWNKMHELANSYPHEKIMYKRN